MRHITARGSWPILAHELEPFGGITSVSRANQAAAFERISRSNLTVATEQERGDARRHSEAQRVLLGRVLDEVEDLALERSCPDRACDGPHTKSLARSSKFLAQTHKSRTWAEATKKRRTRPWDRPGKLDV